MTRRLVSIVSVVAGFALLTAALPVLLPAALVTDLFRYLSSRRAAVASRLVVFGWIYLLGELWAVAALAAVGVLGRDRGIDLTYRLQAAWTAWNLNALRSIFGLSLESEGPSRAPHGPFVILARHVSLVDSLLPASVVADAWRVRLRYVLKKELLLDPALDIAGNRLPNYFLDRSAPSESEIAAMRMLASETPESDGLVIFPEGTRFSEAKHDLAVARHAGKSDEISRLSSSYRLVLPPRPAGTLALLDETDGDVVVLAHTGLEGLAGVRDLWAGGLVGRTINVKTWVIPRADIPEGRSERVLWLLRTWMEVDDWIVSLSSPAADGLSAD